MQSAKECSRQSWRKRAWVRLTRLRSDSNATVCSHSFHPLNQPARTPTWSRNIMIWWAGSRYQDLGSVRGRERDAYNSMTMLCSSIKNHHADVSKNTLAFTFTWGLTENSPLRCYLLVGTNVLHHWSWVLELGLAVGNPCLKLLRWYSLELSNPLATWGLQNVSQLSSSIQWLSSFSLDGIFHREHFLSVKVKSSDYTVHILEEVQTQNVLKLAIVFCKLVYGSGRSYYSCSTSSKKQADYLRLVWPAGSPLAIRQPARRLSAVQSTYFESHCWFRKLLERFHKQVFQMKTTSMWYFYKETQTGQPFITSWQMSHGLSVKHFPLLS